MSGTLKAVLTETPDAALAGFYTEQNGRFILNVEAVDGFALEDISGLKSALQKQMAENKTLKERGKAFADIDPDAARDALAKLEELAGGDIDKLTQAKVDAAVKKLAAQHQSEAAKLQEHITAQHAQLDKLIRADAITKAVAEAKGNIELLEPLITQRTRVTDDGKLELIDADGTPMLTNSGEPLTVSQFVAQLRSDKRFGGAFEGLGNTGSGKLPNAAGGDANAGKSSFAGSKEERLQAIKNQFGL